MLNKIWFGLLLIGILYAFGKGATNSLSAKATSSSDETQILETESENPQDTVLSDTTSESPSEEIVPPGLEVMGKRITEAALGAAETSVTLCIGLIGTMALWLGMLNIAKDAGLVDAFARLLRPVMRWLFPDVPNGHPAQGAMLMNISANMLGLDNAATPMGLKAMQELQTLNPVKDTASNSMATFLAINTSNVTIIPITIIGYRVAAGSDDPAGPLVPILLTTTVTTIVAVIVVRMLSRLPAYSIAAEGNAEGLSEETEAQ